MRRIFYGWYVVGACSLEAIMTWGIGVFNQGVFLGFYSKKYGWSPSMHSGGAVLFHLWAGVAGVVVGRVIDRRGPREILIVGSLSLGAGAIVFGLARQPWHVCPAILLLATGFACLHTVTLGKIVSLVHPAPPPSDGDGNPRRRCRMNDPAATQRRLAGALGRIHRRADPGGDRRRCNRSAGSLGDQGCP